MSKRYGGKFSPDGARREDATPGQFDRAQVDPVGARANVMFIPAIPLVATTFFDGGISMVLGLIGAGFLTLGAFLLRGGLEAEHAYNDRKVARRPAIPRKIFSTSLTGLGVAFAVLAHQDSFGLVAPILFGAVGAGLHTLAFGIDPLKHKGMEGIDTFQQDRVARVVDEAEAHLNAMKDAILRSGDRDMESQVERFQTVARDLIRTVEEDPRDLSAARKYLGVYLRGARDATSKYADIYSRTRDAQAQQDFGVFLEDMTNNFSARTRKLLIEDRTDLNIEIDVLRDRLAREGVRLNDS
ncbi:MAG: 5-bromo-4-chloroindolyl phosphate hydrolysis family protein [Paracoccaceae bacterium]